MNYESFCQSLFASLMKVLPEGCSLRRHSVLKTNGQTQDAFFILRAGSSFAPLVYLKPLYRCFQDGESLESLCAAVLNRLERELPANEQLLKRLQDPEEIKSRLAFRLISQKSNEKLLEDLPWIPYLDMAIVFYIHIERDESSQMTSFVHTDQAESLGLDTGELYRIAMDNTPRILPSKITPLEQLIFGEENCPLPHSEESAPFYVLTNSAGIYGAACILYQDLLFNFAASFEGGSVLVIPSSVHETILVPDTGESAYDALRRSIRDVNRTAVAPEDVLSEQLYRYSRGDSCLRIA